METGTKPSEDGATDRPDGVGVSVIVPVFNEEEALPLLVPKLREALDGLGRTWEILLCDDGSTDRSREILDGLAGEDPRIKVIAFRRNFGQTAAMSAGFAHARGEFVVPIDADLQNDPADIPRLLAKAEEGFDVVSGWRKKRNDPFLTKVLPSRIANWIIGRITGVRLHDYGCTLKAYRREILADIRLYGEMHRFIPAFAHWAGGRVTELPVEHHPRRLGKSKYTLGKAFRVVPDLMSVRFLVTSAKKPLYFFGKYGLLAMFAALFLFGWTLWGKFHSGIYVHRNPLFMIGVVAALVGFQMIVVGLLAELSTRIYHEARDKPTYVVKYRRNLASPRPAREPPPEGG